MSERLFQRISSKEAIIAVIGLGYVGLPLALEFVVKGFRVIGFDVDSEKVSSILSGRSYIHHILETHIREAVSHGLEVTSETERLADADAILICVPTPLTDLREPDLSFVVSTSQSVARVLRPNQLVVLESTTYPGTTRDVVRPILEAGGLIAGKDFHLAFSPEREDPSNPSWKTANIPKVVGGLTPECARIAAHLYESIVVRAVPVSSCEVAEAAKILENTFRAVNIALVNELKMVFTRMGINIWEVIDAAATKPFGFMKFTPGPGMGGHCVPIDPFYLSWKAREHDVAVRFIETAGEINTSIPHWVCQRTLEALSRRGQSTRDARVLIVGLAYKKNVDDTRESPAYRLMQILSEYGAHVDYHDPLVPRVGRKRQFPQFEGKESVPLSEAVNYDVVLICTDHDGIDWVKLKAQARLIVDTRGVYPEGGENVVSA